ncbi:MAG: hypothetical protein LBB45_00485 [Methanobrevibacter sp.]|nr:hypothetical protein [Candidatus Methanovirga basalitermitum]
MFDEEYLSLPKKNDKEIISFFEFVNLIVEKSVNDDMDTLLLNERMVVDRRCWMQEEYVNKINKKQKEGENKNLSPESATLEVPTTSLITFLKKYVDKDHDFGNFLQSRSQTVIYKVNAKFRGDPYPGALVAIDYLQTRNGKHIDDRDKNLVLAWCNLRYNKENDSLDVIESKSSINDFIYSVNKVRDPKKCSLSRDDYSNLEKEHIPRYYMQVKHGCMFSKKKELRVYSSFADAIIFRDGALWKEG